jgi:hypothetical protein
MADCPNTSAVDAVIDKWGGQLEADERNALADEVAYQYYSAVREQLGDKADAATLAELNALARIPQQEKGVPMPASVLFRKKSRHAFGNDTCLSLVPLHI